MSDTLTIKITVIEIADKPKIEPVVADLSNVDYIFLPKSIANISGTQLRCDCCYSCCCCSYCYNLNVSGIDVFAFGVSM